MTSKIDKILNKYDKISQNRNDGLHTERKTEAKDEHFISFMDTDTPIKDNKYLNFTTNGTSHQFDHTEKKISVHEHHFRDGDRKYEHIRQASHSLEIEIERERKLHLQELINLESKVSLLQANNNENLTKMKSQEHLIMLLEEKLKQKEEEVIIYESELEMMERKLREISNEKIGNKLLLNNESSDKALELYREKYEREIYKLNLEIEKFSKETTEKEKEKRKILLEMEIMSKKHIEENKQIRESMNKSEEQFKQWLDESKKEKLNLVEKYEHEIREIKKEYYTEKFNKTDTAILSENNTKNRIKELEKIGTELQNEVIKTKKEVEIQNRISNEITLKLRNFEEDNKNLKIEQQTKETENKNYVEKISNLQEKLQAIQHEKENFKRELEITKKENETNSLKNKQSENQISIMSEKLQKNQEQILNQEKMLQISENNETNMNLSLTQTITNMKTTIKNLELELEDITTELYAERLEKAKILEEFEDSKVELKREYELSLESTKKELESQIKLRFGNTSIDFEKEQLYLEMFKIERKYELLKSEVITSSEVLKMAEKTAQFYHRKKK